MKTLLISLALTSLTANAYAETKLIDQPRYSEKNTMSFNINSILLSDTATIINGSFYSRPNYWVALDKGTKIIGQQSGREYPVLASYGYTLGEECYMPESGSVPLVLKFAPLEANDSIINFAEGSENGFKISGIQLGQNPIKSKIHCHISGTTDDANCSNFILKKEGEMPISMFVVIPVNNGKFHYDLYCDWPETYSLINGNEYRQSAFYNLDFIAENNDVDIIVTHDVDQPKIDIKGGEMNEILNDYNNKRRTLFANAFDSTNALMDSLFNENKLFTDEYMELMDQLSRDDTTPEMRNALYHKRDSLQNIKKQYTPEGNAINDQELAISDNIRKWKIDYAKTHKSIPGLSILKSLAIYSGNKIDDIVEAYNECYAGWEPEHPYSLELATIASSGSINPGTHFIDFSAPDLNGKEMTLSSLAKGKVTLLDLWASWCGPCRVNSKQIIPLYEAYKDKGFTVVGVAREENNTEDMEKAIAKDGYPWINLVELNDKNQIWTKYRISNAAGGTYLIDANGIIVAVNPTPDKVAKYLKENL